MLLYVQTLDNWKNKIKFIEREVSPHAFIQDLALHFSAVDEFNKLHGSFRVEKHDKPSNKSDINANCKLLSNSV